MLYWKIKYLLSSPTSAIPPKKTYIWKNILKDWRLCAWDLHWLVLTLKMRRKYTLCISQKFQVIYKQKYQDATILLNSRIFTLLNTVRPSEKKNMSQIQPNSINFKFEVSGKQLWTWSYSGNTFHEITTIIIIILIIILILITTIIFIVRAIFPCITVRIFKKSKWDNPWQYFKSWKCFKRVKYCGHIT